MDTIRLVVTVGVAAAVREGTGRAGAATVALSPEILGALAPELREVLAGALRSRHDGTHGLALDGRPGGGEALPLPGADASQGPVAAALGAALGAEVALRAELAREVGADLEGQIEHGGGEIGKRWGLRPGTPGQRLADRCPEHPALAPLRDELARRNAADAAAWRAEYLAGDPAAQVAQYDWRQQWSAPALPRALAGDAEVRAHWRAVEAAAEAREAAEAEAAEAAKAAKVARAEAARAAMLAHAESRAATSEAWAGAALVAREGYDASEAVAEAVVGELVHAMRERGLKVTAYAEGTAAYESWSWERRPKPRPAAVAVAVAAREAMAQVALPAAGVAVDSPDVMRATFEDDGGSRTVVGVLVDVVGAQQRALMIDAE